jgi:hypothetical protein
MLKIFQHFGKHCSCHLQGETPAAKTQGQELDKINSEGWILFTTFAEEKTPHLHFVS